MSDLEKRYSFQPFTDGNTETFTMFEKVGESTRIMGFERQGIIYYVVLIEGFNGHKAWVSLKLDGYLQTILDSLIDCSLGTIEVLGDECPLLSQSILNGINKRYENGSFVKIANDWFFMRDFWVTWENGVWVNSSWEITENLIRRLTQMLDEFNNFKDKGGFNWKQSAKIAAKDLSYGYKKLRPYIAVGKIIVPH